MRSVLVTFLAAGALCAQRPETRRDKWDVEALFASNVVIDGNANYYSTISGSGIGQPDFTKDEDGLSVKQSVGVDIAAITLSSVRNMEGQWNSFQRGRFKGAILIQTASDLDRAIRERKYGVLFYCQTHYKLEGNVSNIARWYEKGLRIFQLQYGGHDGNQGPDEKLGCGTDQKGGLTQLGEMVVRELARLHMVIDLSHCNEETILDTAKLAKRLGVPITANHSGARGIKLDNGRYRARYARNMTDKAMKAIADTSGVVAVMAYGPYLRGPYQKVRYTPPTRNIRKATVHDYVAHIDYMVKRVGADHVGLSTDGYLDGTMAHNRTADGILDSPRRWKVVVQLLHEKGYSDADLKKIVGGNFLRVYRKVLAPRKQ